MKYLSIDPGSTHFGFAVADSENELVSPLATLSAQDINRKILNVISTHQPDVVIVGVPSFGPTKLLSEAIYTYLNMVPNLKCFLHNEDFSTSQSQTLLSKSGHKLSKRKELNHSAAAAFILESYLSTLPK